MVVVLDLGSFGLAIAEIREYFHDAIQRARDRMNAAEIGVASRQGNIDAFFSQAFVERCILERGFAFRNRLLQLFLGAIDALALRLALVRRQLAELLQLFGDQPGFAQQGHAQAIERFQRCGGADLPQRLFDLAAQSFHIPQFHKLRGAETHVGSKARPAPHVILRHARATRTVACR